MACVVVGGAAWLLAGGLRAVTGLEWRVLAIGVGVAVGFAVRQAIGGHGGRAWQVFALAACYLALSASFLPLPPFAWRWPSLLDGIILVLSLLEAWALNGRHAGGPAGQHQDG